MEVRCVLPAVFVALVSAAIGPLPYPVVRSTRSGAVYAKSVPGEREGQKGQTRVFWVRADRDIMVGEYDWYAKEIYVTADLAAVNHTLVRFGSWHVGSKPEDDHLAIGIYRDGKTLREYSTAEIHKLGSGVSDSASQHGVFGQRLGFRYRKKEYGRYGRLVYEVKGVSGKLFAFDAEDTGLLVEDSAERAASADAETRR